MLFTRQHQHHDFIFKAAMRKPFMILSKWLSISVCLLRNSHAISSNSSTKNSISSFDITHNITGPDKKEAFDASLTGIPWRRSVEGYLNTGRLILPLLLLCFLPLTTRAYDIAVNGTSLDVTFDPLPGNYDAICFYEQDQDNTFYDYTAKSGDPTTVDQYAPGVYDVQVIVLWEGNCTGYTLESIQEQATPGIVAGCAENQAGGWQEPFDCGFEEPPGDATTTPEIGEIYAVFTLSVFALLFMVAFIFTVIISLARSTVSIWK